ncbi:oxygen-independent coproporphyrinogen III oxidase [Nitzschia inconspicua]|uniref:Radical S-adenosyl methionine domain-containing protein 1, mitochondrial n=1 Tax=Nitzschia inconspicua TaxID=303405 RepID=A0A9K3PGN0_9STRA|nr:oxygen-independent coproporphyrinogen III oxidase [Nitzschia inconspicua]
MYRKRLELRGRVAVVITIFVLLQFKHFSVSFVPVCSFHTVRQDHLRSFSSRINLQQTIEDRIYPCSSSSPNQSDQRCSTGLYFHIPYCRQRCRYCDFAIVPIGNAATNDPLSSRRTVGFEQMNDRYINALLAEIRQTPLTSSRKIPLQSIYFGGGTPSLAPIKSIATILQCACRTADAPFVLDPDAEITMEMDPGTFDLSQLQALKELGVNRISLGVQSLDDAILEGMGRFHRRQDIGQAICDIAKVFGGTGDVANYSIDLISGAPGLTLAKWVDTLQEVTCGDLFAPVRPNHISIYDLQIEVGTVFDKIYGNRQDDGNSSPKRKVDEKGGPLRLPTEEECAFMYKYAAGYLRAKSFEHYEVSSYAYAPTNINRKDASDNQIKPSWRSRHNQIYWDYEGSWYAMGLGATSFVNRNLVARPRTMSDYLEWVEKETNGANVVKSNDADDFLPDLLLKRLRTSDGLDLGWVEQQYGDDVVKGVLKGAQLGLELELATLTEAHVLRLQDPDGFLYSNFIISSIFAELGLADDESQKDFYVFEPLLTRFVLRVAVYRISQIGLKFKRLFEENFVDSALFYACCNSSIPPSSDHKCYCNCQAPTPFPHLSQAASKSAP